MKAKFFLAVSLALISLSTFSQENKIMLDSSKKTGSATKSQMFTIPCLGELNTPSVDLKWKPVLTKKHISFEPKAPNHEAIKQMKTKKLQLKQQQSPNGTTSNSEPSSRTVTPIMGTNFAGNTNSGSSPLDNNIAISDGGIIVSVANSTLEIDNISGTNLYYNNLATFYNDPSIVNVCDPVILYDKPADRFILFFQECSGNSANSYLCICFSKTNNPATGGWWNYKLTGNPLNNNSWFDYPKMAISNNELYITGNLFSNSGSFQESLLYQIEKTAAYTGGSINWQYWSNISGFPFTLLPVGSGQGLSYGPGCYLVASSSGGSSNIDLYDLTDYMSATNEQLNHYNVSTTAYSPAADASQLGTTCLLDNGDCRALSGFYLDGLIHFVFHSDIGSGWNGVNYNRMDLSTLTNQSSTYGLVGSYDYSYPSVVSYATTTTDKSVMVGFGRSGSSIYPEVRVVNCDNSMNWSSSLLVKASSSYAQFTSTTEERWGDYTGTTRKHNSTNPSIWMNGMFGKSNHVWDTWIAEIHDSSSPLPPVADFSASSTNVCANDCISFTDNSTNSPTSWSWSFQGGTPSSSTSQNPTNICYNTPGVYNVTLTATSANGSDTKTITNYIIVTVCSQVPVASFTASSTDLCRTNCINFTDNSTNNPTNWSWSFPGGTPSSSTSQNPTNICYNSEGTYNVTLNSSNSAGNNTKTNTNYITVNTCTGVAEASANSSDAIYPNPIIENFTIEFSLKENTDIEIAIIDISGSVVKELYNGRASQGENVFSFNKSNLSTGVYFLVIKNSSKIIKNEKIIISN